MAWTYSSTRKMEKLLKGLSKKAPALHTELLARQALIAQEPTVGYHLSGDLRDFMSYDFTFKGIAVRICYVIHRTDSHITFVFCGIRENFYRDVKKYLFS